MRPQGSPAELERRRKHAIELLDRDVPVHVVAERLGVDRRSVRRWKRAYRHRGEAGLVAHPAAGRPPKLTARQRHTLGQWILKGPETAGSPTGLWTCRRIAQVVQARFGVIYHPDHIGRLLRACGLSPPRPQRTAKERDERRVRPWVQIEWPRVKKPPPAGSASRLPR
jgi:transposase